MGRFFLFVWNAGQDWMSLKVGKGIYEKPKKRLMPLNIPLA